MGVMSCYRTGCGSIMCHTYVDAVGYICWECQNEFKEYLDIEGKPELSEGELKKELKKFMEIEKGEHLKGNIMSVDDFFQSYSR